MKTVFAAAILLIANADAPDRSEVKAKVEQVLSGTKTLSWYQSTWATNGKKEEKSAADCYWAGQEKMRLNMKEGRGKGATALYRDGKVIGFQPGLFSFVKLTYDVRDKEVLGVRGSDVSQNGFMDDFQLILDQWESVGVAGEAGKLVLTYRNQEGLPTKMTLAKDSFAPERIESYENEKTVERFEYAKVVFNPKLDEKLFEP